LKGTYVRSHLHRGRDTTLTHYLMFTFTALNPTWLTEGLAEYVSHQPAGLSSEYTTSEVYERLMHRPQVLTVSGLFGQDPHTDYPLAMACVTYLVDHGGIAKVKQLMAAFAGHHDAPYEDQYTRQSLRQVYGLTPASVAHGAFRPARRLALTTPPTTTARPRHRW
jgi:hypothetical protein